MHPRARLSLLFALLLACVPALAGDYVPPRHDWARVAPAEAGLVIVTRWTPGLAGVVGRVLEALREER